MDTNSLSLLLFDRTQHAEESGLCPEDWKACGMWTACYQMKIDMITAMALASVDSVHNMTLRFEFKNRSLLIQAPFVIPHCFCLSYLCCFEFWRMPTTIRIAQVDCGCVSKILHRSNKSSILFVAVCHLNFKLRQWRTSKGHGLPLPVV